MNVCNCSTPRPSQDEAFPVRCHFCGRVIYGDLVRTADNPPRTFIRIAMPANPSRIPDLTASAPPRAERE